MKNVKLVICLLFCCTATAAIADSATGNYGPVQPNEGLYRIALKLKHSGVTVSQMMMSIFRHNPDAFERGNINRLRAGVTLTIPDLEYTRSIGRKQAQQDVIRHIEAYESDIRSARVRAGELEPLGTAPREPDLDPFTEIAAMKQEIENEEQTPARAVLPEPAAATTKRREIPRGLLFRYSYDASVVHDDNIRLAKDDDDIREDTIYSGTIKARAGKSLDSHRILNFGGLVGYNLFDTFDDLNHTEIEANVKYRFALSSGFTSPIYSFGARLGGLEYDSEMRDSTLLTLSAEMNKWLTTKINMTAALQFKERESVSEVYDTSEARIFVNFDTEFSKRDLLYTTFTFIDGDIVSSAEPTLAIINASDAIEPDDAFGGVDANQFAYRIDAETVVVTIGYNRIVNRDLSLDFSARFVDSESKDDDSIYYERQILRASILGRF